MILFVEKAGLAEALKQPVEKAGLAATAGIEGLASSLQRRLTSCKSM